jgi:hypothetical protein
MKPTKIEKARLEGKVILLLNNDKLLVVNNCMSGLDSLQINGVGRQQKSLVSICFELRTELLQKAVKMRQNDKTFAIKLSHYKAEALYNYLKDYSILFPDNFGTYENNLIELIKNEIHPQLL